MKLEDVKENGLYWYLEDGQYTVVYVSNTELSEIDNFAYIIGNEQYFVPNELLGDFVCKAEPPPSMDATDIIYDMQFKNGKPITHQD